MGFEAREAELPNCEFNHCIWSPYSLDSMHSMTMVVFTISMLPDLDKPPCSNSGC